MKIAARKKEFDNAFWKACIHEAGHVVVAHYLGYLGAHMRVYSRPEADIGEGEYPVAGKANLCPTPDIDENAARLCGLAGPVAEYLLDEPDPGEADDGELYCLLELGEIELSPSDAKSAGAYTEDDVEQCMGIVQECWDRILTEARWHFDCGPR